MFGPYMAKLDDKKNCSGKSPATALATYENDVKMTSGAGLQTINKIK